MSGIDSGLEALRLYDTPTICNGLEVLDAKHRRGGFTRAQGILAPSHLVRPEGHRAICGPALTARIRANDPHGMEPREAAERRYAWYERVAANPGCVIVIEDEDERPVGAFWGEVHSALHRALGAAGCVTNGVVRDLDDLDEGFPILAGSVLPSHAHVRLTGWGEGASVLGLDVAEGDLIHADAHGAVIVPLDAVAALPEAIAQVQAKERRLLDLAADPPIDRGALRAALGLEEG